MATAADRIKDAAAVGGPAFRVEARGPSTVARPAREAGDARPTRAAPLGNVSIDMDTLADYARGYGFGYQRRPDPVYETGLARFLDVLRETGVRATIFAIGRDALVPEHRAVLERAVAEGHEIANHTLTHPRRLAALAPADLQREIGEAHDILSELRGAPLSGFRAPCYDVDRGVLDELERRDYLYDSSVHPTLLTPVIDLAVFLKSRCRNWEARPSTYLHALAPLTPYYPGRFPWLSARRANLDGGRPSPPPDVPTFPRGADGRGSEGHGSGRLLEIPLSAAPICRLPFYGTFIQAAGMKMFRRLLAWCRWWRRPLSFHYHAVELVSLGDAGVSPDFAVHPGLSRPAGAKLADVREMLSAFAGGYELMTLEEVACRAGGEVTRRSAVAAELGVTS